MMFWCNYILVAVTAAGASLDSLFAAADAILESLFDAAAVSFDSWFAAEAATVWTSGFLCQLPDG